MAASKATCRKAKQATVNAALTFAADAVPDCASLLALAEVTAQLIAENCSIARLQELVKQVKAIEAKAIRAEQRRAATK